MLKQIVRDEQQEEKAGCCSSLVSAATCSPCDNSVIVISTLIYHPKAKDLGTMYVLSSSVWLVLCKHRTKRQFLPLSLPSKNKI